MLNVVIHKGNKIQWPPIKSGFRPVTKNISFNTIASDELAWQPSSLGFNIVLIGILIISDGDTTITLKGSEQGIFMPVPLKTDIPFSPNFKIPIWVGNKGETILFDVANNVDTNLILIGYEES